MPIQIRHSLVLGAHVPESSSLPHPTAQHNLQKYCCVYSYANTQIILTEGSNRG